MTYLQTDLPLPVNEPGVPLSPKDVARLRAFGCGDEEIRVCELAPVIARKRLVPAFCKAARSDWLLLRCLVAYLKAHLDEGLPLPIGSEGLLVTVRTRFFGRGRGFDNTPRLIIPRLVVVVAPWAARWICFDRIDGINNLPITLGWRGVPSIDWDAIPARSGRQSKGGAS